MKASEFIFEKWSQKYKSSINCSHPKGFSQRAHCAGKQKQNESVEMVCEDCGMCEAHANTYVNENLRDWFKDKWVRFGPDGEIRGDCARGSSKEGKPKCLPQSKAHSLGKKGRASAASRKRREDPDAERSGKAINVNTKKTNEEQLDELSCWPGHHRVAGTKAGAPGSCEKNKTNESEHSCPHCGGEMVSEELMNEKKDACYYKVKSRYKVWPSAYASGALVKCRKKGADSWGTGGKSNESVTEGPAVNAYMAGKSPAIAHFADQLDRIASKAQGVAEGTAGLPDPNDFDSDWEYQDALAAYGKTQDSDADYENMIDEPNDWFDESREKVGNMDADAFDDALARIKKLAGAGPLKTVYDPTTRRYKNVPIAVQPTQQPRKVNK